MKSVLKAGVKTLALSCGAGFRWECRVKGIESWGADNEKKVKKQLSSAGPHFLYPPPNTAFLVMPLEYMHICIFSNSARIYAYI